jgi:CheY-like chemotaxis protein
MSRAVPLILMDLRMPGVSGVDVMRELRDDPSFARVPVIVLTAQALDDERTSAPHAGFDGVISKSSLPDELFRAVAHALAT